MSEAEYQPADFANQPAAAEPKPKGNCKAQFMFVVRIIVIASGPILIALGILAIIFAINGTFVSWLLGIYQIIFGALLFFGEFQWKRMLFAFPFLLTRRNRSVFLALCATLCYGLRINGYKWPGIVAGSVLLAVAILYFVMTFIAPSKKDQANYEEFKARQSIDPNAKK
ncbi:hypothetical protein BLNAU_16829 [Blattamonas nauphoetae]|uniref:COPI associated protein n=1 Tax=Blattamonas nauphoetae TaxID=2049346 RepID=A0ABQ9XAF8_9EUKA|nr:hypothetical protein BLNAU_16829 [Blattamonas nauphoetae]